MTAEDWSGLIMASNEAAMQWYALATQKTLPSQPDTIATPLPGGGMIRVGNISNVMLILGIAVLAFIVLRK